MRITNPFLKTHQTRYLLYVEHDIREMMGQVEVTFNPEQISEKLGLNKSQRRNLTLGQRKIANFIFFKACSKCEDVYSEKPYDRNSYDFLVEKYSPEEVVRLAKVFSSEELLLLINAVSKYSSIKQIQKSQILDKARVALKGNTPKNNWENTIPICSMTDSRVISTSLEKVLDKRFFQLAVRNLKVHHMELNRESNCADLLINYGFAYLSSGKISRETPIQKKAKYTAKYQIGQNPFKKILEKKAIGTIKVSSFGLTTKNGQVDISAPLPEEPLFIETGLYPLADIFKCFEKSGKYLTQKEKDNLLIRIHVVGLAFPLCNPFKEFLFKLFPFGFLSPGKGLQWTKNPDKKIPRSGSTL